MTAKDKLCEENEDQESELSAIIAGFARSVSVQLMLFMRLGLAYYFKFPIKLFRPAPFNTYGHLRSLHRSNRGWITIAQSEWKLIVGRTLPLLMINGSIGAVLFTVYTGVEQALKNQSGQKIQDSTEHRIENYTYTHPFIAGGIAGIAQALISTPLHDIEAHLESRTHKYSNTHKAVSSLKLSTSVSEIAQTNSTFKKQSSKDQFKTNHEQSSKSKNSTKPTSNTKSKSWNQTSFNYKSQSWNQQSSHPELKTVDQQEPNSRYKTVRNRYKGLVFNMLRDSLGFSLFFGVFESCQHLGQNAIHKYIPKDSTLHPWSETIVLIASGTLGGISYQTMNHPFLRIRNRMERLGQPEKARVRDIVDVTRARGIGYLFKGLAGSMVRVVPPSALALCLYKLI